jgi:hypothetical protein
MEISLQVLLHQESVALDEHDEFQDWLQVVKLGYQGTFQEYQEMFDDEGNLI